jgi:hypothetical protein
MQPRMPVRQRMHLVRQGVPRRKHVESSTSASVTALGLSFAHAFEPPRGPATGSGAASTGARRGGGGHRSPRLAAARSVESRPAQRYCASTESAAAAASLHAQPGPLLQVWFVAMHESPQGLLFVQTLQQAPPPV